MSVIKTGLTGEEKKLAKNFGGVAVVQDKNGSWQARFADKDVYTPLYGGSIIMGFATASDMTAVRAAKELLRLAQIDAELGRPFYVGDKTQNPEYQRMQDDLIAGGFKAIRLPSRRR